MMVKEQAHRTMTLNPDYDIGKRLCKRERNELI